MTQSKINSIMRAQVQAVFDMVQEKDPWLAAAYAGVITSLVTKISMDKFKGEELEEFRQLLHLVNSAIANSGDHGGDPIEDSKLFGYLYSVHDLFLNLEEEE